MASQLNARIRPRSSSELSIGYCTNVHAGVDLPTIRENLSNYAVKVRESLSDGEALGLGLWLPHQAAGELRRCGGADFADFLRKLNLRAFTINGFPFDNFHETVVKHRVYEPTWWQTERLDYTKCLAEVLVELLPDDEPMGSISTLPIGWPTGMSGEAVTAKQLEQAGANFRELAEFLEQLHSRTGRRVVVAIEPEPGCILDSCQDCVDWFTNQLPEATHRRYITVCHDVCHSAVMMEPQQEVLARYAKAGIGIGKVQVSSAIVADWQSMAVGRRHEALDQLSAFAEDRYLHQTGRRTASGEFVLEEDLPRVLSQVRERVAQSVKENDGGGERQQAASSKSSLKSLDPVAGDDRWVIHFHVPIFLERFGHLTTSHAEVVDCLRTLLDGSASGAGIDFSGHLEVETYAWSVLPEAMRRRGLAEDIAGEIRWLKRAIVESL